MHDFADLQWPVFLIEIITIGKRTTSSAFLKMKVAHAESYIIEPFIAPFTNGSGSKPRENYIALLLCCFNHSLYALQNW